MYDFEAGSLSTTLFLMSSSILSCNPLWSPVIHTFLLVPTLLSYDSHFSTCHPRCSPVIQTTLLSSILSYWHPHCSPFIQTTLIPILSTIIHNALPVIHTAVLSSTLIYCDQDLSRIIPSFQRFQNYSFNSLCSFHTHCFPVILALFIPSQSHVSPVYVSLILNLFRTPGIDSTDSIPYNLSPLSVAMDQV
jgi:hypothetical protein